jgi:DNA-binding beta-propeller fold protein YncE
MGLIGLLLAFTALIAVNTESASAAQSVYATNAGGPTISQFDIGAGGLLSPKSPATVATGGFPAAFSIVASPDGRSVYVANNVGHTISQYTVGLGGVLVPKTPATVPAGAGPVGIAVSPDGKSVYVANFAPAGTISQYDVGPGGALSPKTPATVATGAEAESIAIGTDGSSVYVTSDDPSTAGTIWQYDVGPGGRLSPKTPYSVTAGPFPPAHSDLFGIAITPDGRSVYAANRDASEVWEFDVGPGGRLVAKSQPTVAVTGGPVAIGITPDGRSAYVASQGARLAQYNIAAGEELTPKSPATVSANIGTDGIAMTADGKNVYVSNFGDQFGNGGSVLQYDVGAGGVLSEKTPTAVASGKETFALTVLPDQGPTAAFSAGAARAGSATSFDGSASHDPDGRVARYDWSFGDGKTAVDAGPTPTHVYATPGSYTVTLRVTDDAGCSSVFLFTGQTAYCNGGPRAIATRQISVAKPSSTGMKPTGVKITKANISSKRHTARFSFKALGNKTSFQCALIKHRKRGKQPKPRFKRCQAPKTYEHLKAGRYTFLVRALSGAGPGRPTSREFRIA